jgi:phospholipid transport system substrate-binding protein
MHKYLRLFALFLALQFGIGAGMPVSAADEPAVEVHKEREAFARDFAQVVINIIRDPKTRYQDRQNILRNSFRKSVDIDWIAKFVLGRAWKDASDEQKERYVSLYKKFLTETYITHFAENPDKGVYDIKVTGVNDEVQDNTFTVHTHTRLMDKTNLNVDYLVYDQEKKYTVRDIVIENISLISTHRAEFTRLAGTTGIEGVIQKLEQLLSQGKEAMTASLK